VALPDITHAVVPHSARTVSVVVNTVRPESRSTTRVSTTSSLSYGLASAAKRPLAAVAVW